MLPLKPFKLSCYLFTQKHLNTHSYYKISSWLSGNTHCALSASKEYFSIVPLQSSLCVSYFISPTFWCLWYISRELCLLFGYCAVPDFWWLFPLQVQNASDLLIKPLEKFRKEQIGVTKVSVVGFCWLCCAVAENLDQMQSQIMTQQHPELPTQASSSARKCIFRYIYALYTVIFVK